MVHTELIGVNIIGRWSKCCCCCCFIFGCCWGFFVLFFCSLIYLLVRLDSRVGVVPVKVLCKNRPSSVNVIFTHLVNLARKTLGL